MLAHQRSLNAARDDYVYSDLQLLPAFCCVGSGERPVSWSTVIRQQGLALSLRSSHSTLFGEKLRLRAKEDEPLSHSANPSSDLKSVWLEAYWKNLSLLFHKSLARLN